MINVKITMTNGTEYNIRNIADNIKDFYKRVMAPYGTNMTFVEIMSGELINTANIVSIREMDEVEVAKLNEPAVEEVEEVVGLTDTEIEVEELGTEEPEPAK